MSELIWVILPPFFVYLFTIARKTGYFNASSLFAYFQLAMAVGTLPLLDATLEPDQLHAFLIVATFLLFLVVTSILAVMSAQKYDLSFDADVSITLATRGIWILIAVSILICAAYYYALGYNVLTSSLAQVLSGSDTTDLAGLRLDAYSGAQYLFPGYVNQFRNVLLPSLTVVVVMSLFHTRSTARWLVVIVLVPTTLLFVLGTGQRGAFVTFAIVIVVFLYYVSRRTFRKWVPLVVIISLPLFMLSTVALGRSRSQLDAANGPLAQILVLWNQVIFRAFGSNQMSSVVGFRYIYDLPVQYGTEWLRALAGLLPGVPGSDISNQIYAQFYGTTRGTAPLSIWGSAYYNFGTVGTLLVACLLAVLLHSLTIHAARIRNANSLQLIGMAGVFTTLGSWVVGDTTYLFNVGVIVFIFLWVWGSRQARRDFPTHAGDSRSTSRFLRRKTTS